MKIRITSNFTVQVDARTVTTYPHGEYSIPKDIPKDHAEKAVRLGSGRYIQEKKAPENKLADVPENKTKVARKKPVRRSRSGSKPQS